MWAGITPQAPWTRNWISTAPATRRGSAVAHEQTEERGQPADEEHRTPPPARKHHRVTQGGEGITGGVPLLEQPRIKSAASRRHVLHDERRPDPPLASHSDSEQRAEHEKG